MERIIKQDEFGDIACNDIIIYSDSTANLERNIKDFSSHNWKIIEPEYFRYRDDNVILEIWYNGKGILLSGNIEGYVGESFTTELIEKITYEEAMYLLDKEQRKGLRYNNKDLMSRVITNGATGGLDAKSLSEVYVRGIREQSKENSCCEIGIDYTGDDLTDAMAFHIYENELTQSFCLDCVLEDDKQNNNGGASDWYALPKNANTLQDLIEHRNMNGSVKDIFKACYRLGIKTEDELRDLNKMAYYSLREVGRITGRKDYITIAKELIGSQAIEKE